jgi:gluconokinase
VEPSALLRIEEWGRSFLGPALHILARTKALPEQIRADWIDPGEGTAESWRDYLYCTLQGFVGNAATQFNLDHIDEAVWKRLAEKIVYVQGDLTPGGASLLVHGSRRGTRRSELIAMETRPTEGASHPAPAVMIVMGVSGSGKSTIGGLLALRLQWEFEDADWLHPASNVEKMHEGIPLTDEDRWPWLEAISVWIDKTRRTGGHGVIACSALKRRYRDVLIGDRPDVRLVYLNGDETLIARRIATPHEHFMPRSLLHSQFEVLEEPGPDENPIVVSIEPAPREIVAQVLSALSVVEVALPLEQPAPRRSGART